MFGLFKKTQEVVKQAQTQYIAIPIVAYEMLSSEERGQHLDAMNRDGWEFCHRGLTHIVQSRESTDSFPRAMFGKVYGVKGAQEISEKQADRILADAKATYVYAPNRKLSGEEADLRKLFSEFAKDRNLHQSAAANLMTLLRKKASQGKVVTESDLSSAEFKRLGNAQLVFGDKLGEILDFQNRQAQQVRMKAS
jgi:hypothetical protein